MSRERARVLRWGRRESLESGGVRAGDGVKGLLGARVAVGSRKEVSTAETDLVRWKIGARCVARKDWVAKSFWGRVSSGEGGGGGYVPRYWRSIR